MEKRRKLKKRNMREKTSVERKEEGDRKKRNWSQEKGGRGIG